MSDWERYLQARLTESYAAEEFDALCGLPIWQQYPEDVPVVSPRTRVAIVAITILMWTAMLAGIWLALAA